MRIAVVGSGIAGLASAWLLSRDHDVVVYEAADRLGGHTHTHDVEIAGWVWRVVVQRGRKVAVMQRERAKRSFHRPGGT